MPFRNWMILLAAVVLALCWWTFDERTLLLAGNTLWLSAGTALLAVPLGTLLAFLLVRTDLPGRGFWLLLLGSMLFVPLYVQSSAWLAGFGLQGWYSLLQIGTGAPPLLDQWQGAIWIHACAAVPWVVLIVGLGLRRVEPELEEQSLMETGATTVFLRITLPRALPAIVAATTWTMVIVAGEITVTDMWQLRTYAEEVLIGFSLGDEHPVTGLGIWPGALLMIVCIIAAFTCCQQLAPRPTQNATRMPHRFSLGAWRLPMLLVVMVTLLVLMGVPLGNLIYKAGVVVTQAEAGRERIWSLGKLLTILADSPLRYAQEFGWSILIGSLAALASVMLAIPFAWRACQRVRWAVGVLAILAVLMAIPGPVLSCLVQSTFQTAELAIGDWGIWLYDQSIMAPWLALTLRSLPLATLILWYAFRSVDTDSLENAVTDGASDRTLLWKVVLPQRLPALAIAGIVTLAMSMADVSSTFMILPPRVHLLSWQVFELVHYGVDDQLAGLCLTAWAMFLSLSLLVVGLLRQFTTWRANDV
jgi:iron(III) transport system permease protein